MGRLFSIQSVVITFLVIICVISILPVFSVIYGYIISYKEFFIPSESMAIFGSFGSYIGGVLSPILTVGSLFYVIKTFKQQANIAESTSKLQSEDSENSRIIVNRQSFESTLTLLLEQHNAIVNELSAQPSLTRPECKSTSNKLIENVINDVERNGLDEPVPEITEVNRYHRVLYQVLKHIDDSNLYDKNKYTRMVRSFIPNNLLYLVSINSARNNMLTGRIIFPKYKKLIERYGMLEHLTFEDIAYNSNVWDEERNICHIMSRYNLDAFGDGINIRNTALKIKGELAFELDSLIKDTHSHIEKVRGWINAARCLVDMLRKFKDGEVLVSIPNRIHVESYDYRNKTYGGDASGFRVTIINAYNYEDAIALSDKFWDSFNVSIKNDIKKSKNFISKSVRYTERAIYFDELLGKYDHRSSVINNSYSLRQFVGEWMHYTELAVCLSEELDGLLNSINMYVLDELRKGLPT